MLTDFVLFISKIQWPLLNLMKTAFSTTATRCHYVALNNLTRVPLRLPIGKIKGAEENDSLMKGKRSLQKGSEQVHQAPTIK